MIILHKLHLARAELDTLALAVKDHQDMIAHALTASKIPFSHEQKSELQEEQGRSKTIAEKIYLLSRYVDMLESESVPKDTVRNHKKAYLDYAINGICPDPNLYDDLSID